MSKVRLDVLVQRAAGVSRAKAQALIRAGRVLTESGRRLDKPGLPVEEDLALVIREGPRFASRGGEKLEAAIEAFQPAIEGVVAIDVGASTGGFTDCLLQHGAQKVYAVDVGYGQLDWALRRDARVVVMERTNVRDLTPDRFDEKPSFFTADCSFISLKLVLPVVKTLLARPAAGIVLIKPQFEAGREQVGKGGVVKDPTVHEAVVHEITAFSESLGFAPGGVIPSPLEGPAGNKEFLLYLRLEA